ncbi:MAG: translation initiation factor IF-1A [Promethearchaeota archaeon]
MKKSISLPKYRQSITGVLSMPKNRRRNQSEVAKRPRIPNYRNDEILGVCTEILGGEHMIIIGEDNVAYLGLIRGKIKKRMWVRVGDVVLIMPWVGMSKPRPGKKPKAHIIWRYTRTQTVWLQNHRYLKSSFIDAIQNI